MIELWVEPPQTHLSALALWPAFLWDSPCMGAEVQWQPNSTAGSLGAFRYASPHFLHLFNGGNNMEHSETLKYCNWLDSLLIFSKDIVQIYDSSTKVILEGKKVLFYLEGLLILASISTQILTSKANIVIMEASWVLYFFALLMLFLFLLWRKKELLLLIMCICLPMLGYEHMMVARRGPWVSWSWSSRQVWATSHGFREPKWVFGKSSACAPSL